MLSARSRSSVYGPLSFMVPTLLRIRGGTAGDEAPDGLNARDAVRVVRPRVEGAPRFGSLVRAAARAGVRGRGHVGERVDEVVRVHVREPERPDPGRVDDPSALRQRERDGRGG